jgi:membrane peptidoglycan carboxypeptidase
MRPFDDFHFEDDPTGHLVPPPPTSRSAALSVVSLDAPSDEELRASALAALRDAARHAAAAARRAQAFTTAHARLLWTLGAALSAAAAFGLVYWEVTTSRLEAELGTRLAQQLTYDVGVGPSPRIRFPQTGPYDLRLGYARLPDFAQRLDKAGYDVTAQARLSPLHDRLIGAGLFPIYQEKSTHGLAIVDAADAQLYGASYPKAGYGAIEAVPPLMVASLLFIEDRQVLGDASRAPTLNPAISWDRLTKATVELLIDKLFRSHKGPGGSTLATQIEKFRHSEDGRTRGTHDKLRQMASASVRAYLVGQDTSAARERIVLDYINSVPLGAARGVGEVSGIGEGVRAWYDEELEIFNAALAKEPAHEDLDGRMRHARAYKRVLALFLAQRRPTFYLQQNQAELGVLANTYVRLMLDAGLISKELAADALRAKLGLVPVNAPRRLPDQPASFVERKAANAVRFDLKKTLGLSTLYELDRLDLDVRSTFLSDLQDAVTAHLMSLKTPSGAERAGLVGEHMLKREQAPTVNYSFTLMERLDDRNVIRVQADTVDSPMDVNDGGRLELGSTAKLRTLITFLEMVSEARAEHVGKDAATLKAELARVSPEDDLSKWLLGYLATPGADTSLEGTLAAVMQRPFSASPWQPFWTGGGSVWFGNYNAADNGLNLTIGQAFQRSNNLVFVRVMKEIVQHVIATRIKGAAAMLANPEDPLRRDYMLQFVDFDATVFLKKFYDELAHVGRRERVEGLVGTKRVWPAKVAAILLAAQPGLTEADFREALAGYATWAPAMRKQLDDKAMTRYWATLRPGTLSLADRAYVAKVHPLALWLLQFLDEHPSATFADVQANSKEARLLAYDWLLNKAGVKRQERDVRTMLEREAFARHVLPYWKRQGFPFDDMTPSYASALGSSGDRPTALAELVGALTNHGVMMRTSTVDELRFGRGTPFETAFGPASGGVTRVTSPEIAATALAAMTSVVEGGTAVRLRGALKRLDGTPVRIAAKTGTGDNRIDTYGPGGRLIRSEARSRTATLVFALGDHFYGAISAYVQAEEQPFGWSTTKKAPPPKVDDFAFTSGLVAQALRSLVPTLAPAVLPLEDPSAFALTSAGASH